MAKGYWIPLPNDSFGGGTVIASTWLRDETPITCLLLLLMPKPPFYLVNECVLSSLEGSWSAISFEAFQNIVPAVDYYQNNGGDF